MMAHHKYQLTNFERLGFGKLTVFRASVATVWIRPCQVHEENEFLNETDRSGQSLGTLEAETS